MNPIEELPKIEMSISELMALPITQNFGRNKTNVFTPWKTEMQQALILAIFYGKEIGKLVTTHDNILWDGRQVYNAIQNFIENKFPIDGKTFEQMGMEQKIIFNEYKVTVYRAPKEPNGNDLFNMLNKKPQL